MGADEIRNKIDDALYSHLCNGLPRGIEYGGLDDGTDLIVTDDGGETEYLVEVEVMLTQTKPAPERRQPKRIGKVTTTTEVSGDVL
ncbi:MAG TPA: hypothetical protein VK735_32610 [Pseudonocardia sp.]|uniref:hypothetical protein n=1 Tax=Pseudonocardia sp. TaxID=60912 RepID=UPI002B6F71B5|nr:hypothetical protein [Pseudonocardia sp.]HTF52211.1 hypothetical protein [Pseudonocardia sp.]